MRSVHRKTKFWMTAAHKEARLHWARCHAHFSKRAFQDWVFVDESMFTIDTESRVCWIGKNEPIPERQKHLYPVKVMVFGAITYYGTCSLMLYPKGLTQDADQYLQMLQDDVMPELYEYFPNGDFAYIQDRAPPHRAKKVQNWLLSQPFHYADDYPARSPDLNIIEHIWALMKLRLEDKRLSTYDQLCDAVEGEWANIDHDDLNRLYRSLPRRMRAVIQAEGGHTKY